MSIEAVGAREPVNILLVDDQPGKLLSYEAMLGGLGENLIRAGSGKEALEQLLKQDVAVILLDVCMPDLDGFELATLIHHHPRFSRTAIIHVSAVNLSDFDRLKGYDSGAMDYVSVPVMPEVLRAKVRVFAELYRKTRELERLNAIAARQLDQSEQRFHFLAETIPSFVWTANPDGRLIWANHRLLDYCGLTADQLPTEAFADVLHPEDRERVQASWNEVLREGRDFEIELRQKGRDGEHRWFLVRAVPQKDEGGRVVRWFGVTTDIHEQKLLSERLRDADRRKDEFLAMLSHELRAPLGPILGWTEVMRRGKLPAGQAEHALNVIERNVKRQAQLIQDLLDVSHIVSGTLRMEFGVVDLRVVVDAGLEMARPLAASKGVVLDLSVPAEPLPVLGDRERLQQVVWNLASNAIKFSDPNGRVEVTLAREGVDARLRVSDNGIGITPEFLPHVFDRFRQAATGTARSYSGLGLGLTIVRHLVDAHGGRVEAESPGSGHGSSFTVELPLAAGQPNDAPVSAAALAETDEPKLPGLKILVVDDEPDARELLRTSLGLEGAQVRVAGSLREAVAAFLEERPDVVVSDIGMPGEDGYRLPAALREVLRDTDDGVPAVALSAHASIHDAERSHAAGYELHLAKPIEPSNVVAALAGLVARRRGSA